MHYCNTITTSIKNKIFLVLFITNVSYDTGVCVKPDSSIKILRSERQTVSVSLMVHNTTVSYSYHAVFSEDADHYRS